MQLTTKSIIKTLPFEDSFKTDLLNQLDQFDPDKKFALERVVWETYDALYAIKLNENLRSALLQVRNHEEKLDENFYKRVREKTEKEMQEEAVQSAEQVDLTAARKAMELIVKEIQAGKNTT